VNGTQLTPVVLIGLIANLSSVFGFAPGYAGSAACKACHADIYRRQEASNHARSLRAAEEVPEFISALPVELQDRASGAVVSIERDSSGAIAVRARKGREEASMRLAFAFGSGVKAITPLARARDGSFIESRLSWYASLKGIEFTTGASRYDPVTAGENLGKT